MEVDTSQDAAVVRALRDGDESAFTELVHRYQASLLRVAQMYVSNRAVAEEVVQETWLAVLKGIERFEGRSSLKTWIFRILTNTAKTRAQREGRTVHPLPARSGATRSAFGSPDLPGGQVCRALRHGHLRLRCPLHRRCQG